MKKLLLSIGLITAASASVLAQTYFTRTGKILFNATSPSSPEKIEAKNNEVVSIVDAKAGSVIFQVLVKSFIFEREQMQEHFNENYMESDKYPKADFKGNIANPADVHFDQDGTYQVKVAGKLTMHGVSNDVTLPGTIVIKGGAVTVNAKFSVKLKDYNITIPSLVADKLGKEAVITVESNLAKK